MNARERTLMALAHEHARDPPVGQRVARLLELLAVVDVRELRGRAELCPGDRLVAVEHHRRGGQGGHRRYEAQHGAGKTAVDGGPRGGRDGAALAAQMAGFEAERRMQLTNAQRDGAAALFTSTRVDEDHMGQAMRWAYDRAGQVVDPHSAIGLAAALNSDLGDTPVVTLATAHPAKFPDAVERATGLRPPLPPRVGDLFDRAERYDVLPATFEAVSGYIAERAVARPGS